MMNNTNSNNTYNHPEDPPQQEPWSSAMSSWRQENNNNPQRLHQHHGNNNQHSTNDDDNNDYYYNHPPPPSPHSRSSNRSDDWMDEVSSHVQSMSLMSSTSSKKFYHSPSLSSARSSKAHHSPNHSSPPNRQCKIEDMEILLTPREGSLEEYERRYAAAVEARAAKANRSMMHSIPAYPAKGTVPTPSHGGAADTMNNGATDGRRLSHTLLDDEVRDYFFMS